MSSARRASCASGGQVGTRHLVFAYRLWNSVHQETSRADSSTTTGASASCLSSRGGGPSSDSSSGPSSPHQEEPDPLSDRLLLGPHIDESQGGHPVKFGELVLLGYNGSLPHGEKGRRRSKFFLYRRPFPNGIKKSKHYIVKTPQSSKCRQATKVGEKTTRSALMAVLDSKQHSISYTLSRTQAVIVEYVLDEETDLFQIGRSSESPIDFVVMDTVAGGDNKAGACRVAQSTISRFACRILCERNRSHRSYVFAAGFDSSRNIFLGEKATKWQQDGEIDGLTTNGVLIMHPQGSFCGGATPGIWREVSVGGNVYAIRESRSAPKKGVRIEDETNVLRDGSLIDLCGATLLFRSAEGLLKSPTKQHLEARVEELNAGRPQCPVGLNTLVIASRATLSQGDKQPYVYLHCGHVQGLHHWGLPEGASNVRTCPMCLKKGPVVKLCVGIEPAFYVDNDPPNHAFNPCGHMASEKTVKYWASVSIPHGTNGLQAACPFCATQLEGYPGYVRLIFQDHID
ncbi:protein pellino-like isoform X1 [Dermacentor silvarum]|uniref:protein pellino-like isoform X1 n=1 Tax=Dermacentor silvarum TaxID=543639 RepID=UPI001897D5DF|nr:protein pellino-like isoform X1 [Dermacentor silvarum]